ncbi:MAG TPA: PA domain-containing protein, partial [Xanthomonadales bacterium]|nr:PA domain-containing protein [Xanthomonadales bacterium]
MFNAGILVSASAGNNGPGASTVGHRGPWIMTVANQTHNRLNKNDVSVNGGPAGLQDMWGQLGAENNFNGMDVNDEILWAGAIDAANFEGCNAWPGGNEFDGSIALISRGGCPFADKVTNAEAAGAVAVIVFNHLSDIPFSMGGIEAASIPSLMIGTGDGEALRDHIIANPGTMVTMEAASQYLFDDNLGSWANSGTSRGPNNFDVTKPDLGGPGTNIFAAYADNLGPPPQYAFLTGTSMSSPHAAGAAALVKAVHPDWSPAEIKSAMMMTSHSGLDEFGDPANPDIEGSGTIDLEKAALAGLIMDENFDNMLAANPATGGDPATLNLPSMRSGDCNGVCSWTRTVCSTLDVATNWTIITPSPGGWSMDVPGPNQIDLAPAGQLQATGFEDDEGATSSCVSFTVEATVTDPALVTANEWIFSQITLIDNTTGSPDLKMTVSIVPTGIDN